MNTITKTVHRLRVWEVILLLGVAVLLSSGVFAVQTQQNLADKVVRFHVLANSDSEEDQALKLRVRDVVLAQAEELLGGSMNRTEAESLLRGQLLELERLALQTVREEGYSYSVTVELADTDFPTRDYGDFTLPAGEYLALRVLIGEAEGQNWWCVVFPPLCTAAALDVSETALAGGLEEEEVALITEESTEYVLKLKIVEIWNMLQLP